MYSATNSVSTLPKITMNRTRSVRSRASAFTLVELLMVISIMAVISTFAVTALNTLGGSDKVASGGRLLSNMVSIARSEAINRRTLVQLRIITTNQSGATDTNSYRKMSLWFMDQTQSSEPYLQLSKWETLPDGIIVEPSTNPTTAVTPPYTFSTMPGTYIMNSSLLQNSNVLTSNPTVPCGTSNYNYAWVEFSPTGGTTYPTAYSLTYILVTEGFISQTGSVVSTVYTQKNHPNWLQVSINSLVGTSKVLRP